MAMLNLPMKRYYLSNPSDTWPQRILNAATAFRQSTGLSPNLAHVALTAKNVPDMVEDIKVVRAWGPSSFEIDLAYIPAEVPAPAETPAADPGRGPDLEAPALAPDDDDPEGRSLQMYLEGFTDAYGNWLRDGPRDPREEADQ